MKVIKNLILFNVSLWCGVFIARAEDAGDAGTAWFFGLLALVVFVIIQIIDLKDAMS